MLKDKLLHRRIRKTKISKRWTVRKYNRGKNVDLFSDLPLHAPIRKKYSSYYGNFDLRPLIEFINSKVGKNWDDIYSEIILKINKKYRYQIDEYLFNCNNYIINYHTFYGDDYIPRDNKGHILIEKCYVDINGVLVKKTKNEILSESKKLLRRQKLLEIIESQKQENKNQEENS
jgi:hypothetical protein